LEIGGFGDFDLINHLEPYFLLYEHYIMKSIRCKKGTHRNKVSGDCEPKVPPKMKREFPRCAKGTRRNKHTKVCEDKRPLAKKMLEIKPFSIHSAFTSPKQSIDTPSPSLKSRSHSKKTPPYSIHYEFHFARPVKHVLIKKRTEKRRFSPSARSRTAKRQRTSSLLK
jgi:hypothetical protein